MSNKLKVKKSRIIDFVFNEIQDEEAGDNSNFNLLKDEIDSIVDENIKGFVKSILSKVDSFWELPLSPFIEASPRDDEKEPGGLVKHTKRVTRAVQIISDSQELSRHEKDVVIAAALLHGVTSGQIIDDEIIYDPLSAYTVDTFVKNIQMYDAKYSSDISSSTIFLDEDIVQSILRVIRCQLGKDSPIPETIPITYVDIILHHAIVLVSNLNYILGEE